MIRFLLLFIIVSSFKMDFAAAQTATPLQDSLILNNNKVITGKIYRYNRRGNVFIKTNDSYLHEIDTKVIQRVVIQSIASSKKHDKAVNTTDKAPCDKPYAFREKGLYNVTYGSALTGFGYNNENQLGFGVNHVIGYQWNRWIGTGIGFGLENFSIDNSNLSHVLPVFVEARGYLLQKRRTPYYSLGAGYSFATKGKDQGVTDAKGGLRLHPAFGMRLGGREDVNFLFDIGYVFQNVELTRSFNTWTREVQIQNIRYKRLCLRIGMIF